MELKEVLKKALVTKAEAKQLEAEASIYLLTNNPAAIGEHTIEHYVNDLYSAFEKLNDALEIKKLINISF